MAQPSLQEIIAAVTRAYTVDDDTSGVSTLDNFSRSEEDELDAKIKQKMADRRKFWLQKSMAVTPLQRP